MQVHKGQYAGDLSGFRGVDESGKPLGKLLGERGVEAVDVCGLAEDICVAATIRDALGARLPARLLTDLSGATSVDAALETEMELAATGADVIDSSQPWP